jgi:predicted RNA binding protein YcfA (HicA-like mRNA interferase family)
VRPRKLLAELLAGNLTNVGFADFVALVEAFGFRQVRRSGSHHIFSRPGVRQLVNLQRVGGQAKPYQIRQVLRLIERYNLQLRDEP